MRLGLDEFIRRLCLHFLPPRFVKIRHYGLLANRGRQQRLDRARALLAKAPAVLAATTPAVEVNQPVRPWPVCPHCGWATLMLVKVCPPPAMRITHADRYVMNPACEPITADRSFRRSEWALVLLLAGCFFVARAFQRVQSAKSRGLSVES